MTAGPGSPVRLPRSRPAGCSWKGCHRTAAYMLAVGDRPYDVDAHYTVCVFHREDLTARLATAHRSVTWWDIDGVATVAEPDAECPKCGNTATSEVDGISWCRPCQLAWFPWTDTDEQAREAD